MPEAPLHTPTNYIPHYDWTAISSPDHGDAHADAHIGAHTHSHWWPGPGHHRVTFREFGLAEEPGDWLGALVYYNFCQDCGTPVIEQPARTRHLGLCKECEAELQNGPMTLPPQ